MLIKQHTRAYSQKLVEKLNKIREEKSRQEKIFGSVWNEIAGRSCL